MRTLDRRGFLKNLGVATGAAVVAGAPVAAAAAEPGAVATAPSRPLPPEPVVAIVRDARLGEITIVSAGAETTYRDRALVKRLLKAAAHNHVVRDGEA
jgi:hypothetical protein